MKVLIGNTVIESIADESTVKEIITNITSDEALVLHNELTGYKTTSLTFTDNDEVYGIYTDMIYKKLVYEDGNAKFVFNNADKVAIQVEQNKADIEYICLMQDI